MLTHDLRALIPSVRSNHTDWWDGFVRDVRAVELGGQFVESKHDTWLETLEEPSRRVWLQVPFIPPESVWP